MRIPLIERTRVFLPVAALGAVLLISAAVADVHSAGEGNAAVRLKKDANGLFILTISDPEGVKSFSLVPATRGPYGGEVRECPRTFRNTNVLFSDPGDFRPTMTASITDCQGNTDELEIPPPQDGATSGRREAPPPAPAPVPAPATESVSGGGTSAGAPSRQAGDASRQAAKASITYPVPELGGCASEAACRAYCDDVANIRACVDFAERHGLIGKEEAERGRKFASAGSRGPGGCRSYDECTAYCEDASRIEECLDFGERHGFLSGRELEEAKVVAKLRKEGTAFPGGCTTKAGCMAYCEAPGHEDECLAFAERSGLLPPEELENARKFLPLIKQGATPGGCRSKAQCEGYCSQPSNLRRCLDFAEAQGLIPAEELAMARKFLPLLERGEAPGGCRSKESCETYCADPAHTEECLTFAEKAGFITAEEAAFARKSGGKGPGGCRSKEACEAYCADPAHQEECFDFAAESGLISEEEADIAKILGCRSREECEGLCADPANQERCAQALGLPLPGEEGDHPPSEEGLPPEARERVREETRERVREETERRTAAGVARCRTALSSVPPQVRLCLEDEYGSVDEACDPPTAITGRISACIASEFSAPAGPLAAPPAAPSSAPTTEGSGAPAPAAGSPSAATGPGGVRVDCALFAAAPRCEYAGPVGSPNYNYCKQCFPER